MSEPTSMAERLYAAVPTPEAHTPAVAPPDAAQRLFSEPEAAAPRTDPDIGRRMFGDTAFTSELPDGALPNFDSKAGREIAQDLGADPEDVVGFRMLAAQHADPTAEQHTGWRRAAETMLKERAFTPADIDLARRYVARDPRLHAALDRGLGSHPQVVERMVLLARSARSAGRFK